MNKEEIRHFKSLLRQGSLRHMNILLDDKFQSELLNIIKNYERLVKENQKQKEVIDKAIEYINNYNVFKVFSFPLMKRWEEEQIKSSIDYEFKISLIKDLKDILKGDSNE